MTRPFILLAILALLATLPHVAAQPPLVLAPSWEEGTALIAGIEASLSVRTAVPREGRYLLEVRSSNADPPAQNHSLTLEANGLKPIGLRIVPRESGTLDLSLSLRDADGGIVSTTHARFPVVEPLSVALRAHGVWKGDRLDIARAPLVWLEVEVENLREDVAGAHRLALTRTGSRDPLALVNVPALEGGASHRIVVELHRDNVFADGATTVAVYALLPWGDLSPARTLAVHEDGTARAALAELGLAQGAGVEMSIDALKLGPKTWDIRIRAFNYEETAIAATVDASLAPSVVAHPFRALAREWSRAATLPPGGEVQWEERVELDALSPHLLQAGVRGVADAPAQILLVPAGAPEGFLESQPGLRPLLGETVRTQLTLKGTGALPGELHWASEPIDAPDAASALASGQERLLRIESHLLEWKGSPEKGWEQRWEVEILPVADARVKLVPYVETNQGPAAIRWNGLDDLAVLTLDPEPREVPELHLLLLSLVGGALAGLMLAFRLALRRLEQLRRMEMTL